MISQMCIFKQYQLHFKGNLLFGKQLILWCGLQYMLLMPAFAQHGATKLTDAKNQKETKTADKTTTPQHAMANLVAPNKHDKNKDKDKDKTGKTTQKSGNKHEKKHDNSKKESSDKQNAPKTEQPAKEVAPQIEYRVKHDTVFVQPDTMKVFKQHLVNITHLNHQSESENVGVDTLIQNYYDKRIAPTLPKPSLALYYFEKIMEIIGIIALLIILAFLLYSLRRNPKGTIKTIEKPASLGEKIESIAMIVNDTNSRIHNLNAQLGIVSPQLDKGTYFFAEVMTSAGPRKSEEIGLGEDIAGVLVREDFACFWILDGVSDNHILKNQQGEFFSSRLLAQHIAWSLQSELLLINDMTFVLKTALKKACSAALNGIQANIDKLSEADRTMLKRRIEARDIPTIATTVMIGLLTKQGHLKICRIGVDKFVALVEGHESRFSNPKEEKMSTDRVAFSLDLDKDGISLIVRQSEINKEAIYEEALANVKTVIGATDGVSTQLLKWIKNQPKFDFSEPAFRQIIGNYPEKTHDDKAMCIIQIKDLLR